MAFLVLALGFFPLVLLVKHIYSNVEHLSAGQKISILKAIIFLVDAANGIVTLFYKGHKDFE